jgi:peptidoglycan/LPS O-acetylase OafA/YrhL
MYARTNTARHLSGISSWIPDSRPQLPAPGPATHTRATLYLPGIDGLRAIAVIAVVLYHADLAWIPGGYLGVEVFFVISGYLITSLLLAEIQRRNGELDLKGFWIRRARRLLPALLLLIGVVVAYSLLFIPEEVAGLRADIIAALTYTTNWYFVFSEQSYFEAVGRQPLLQHLWSLAVEEQFYLFWPLLFIAGLRLLGRKFFLCAIVLSATASTVLMVLLYAPDQESSRLYFGTDTRAAGLLIGAALAFAWSPGRLPGHPILRTSAALDTLGLVALVVLAHQLMTLSEYEPFLYRGGILLTALTTAVIIAVAVHPAAHVGRLLGVRPLRWIGLRSYGIYLWHWPIFMVTRPQLDVPFDGLALFALRIGLTCAIAEFSYRLVETPIRNGALDQGLVALRAAQGQAGQRLALYRSALGTALATLTITLARRQFFK